MTEEERKEFLEAIESQTAKISSSEEASRKFLVKTGIYTKKGNLTKNYKHLCIPAKQDSSVS